MAQGAGPLDGNTINDELIQAFIRIARGDFSVRLPRNHTRDRDDTLAFFVNLIAEELARVVAERERSHEALTDAVRELSEHFLRMAAGDYTVRAQRTGRGDPMDVLAFLFNNTVVEVEEAFTSLQRQRGVLETTLASMQDGVVLLDAEGRIQQANRALSALLGRSNDELLGAPLHQLVDDREHVFVANLLAQVGEASFRDRETLFRTAAGELILLSLNGSPFRELDGKLAGVVLVVRDDRAFRQAQAQLQINDRLAAVGSVAAGVAHEINNPLAYVVSNLDFSLEELGDASDGSLGGERLAEIKRALAAAQHGADRVRQIVADLKTFSRIDSDTITRIDLNRLIDSSVGMIRNEVRHHAQLHKEYGAPPLVEGNEAKLGQVVMNLVQNAAQAIPAGHAEANRIVLRTGITDAGEAFFSVTDTGSGIAPEHRRRIFDAFFTTKPIGVGTGLGLSICHRIVSAMGGAIEVDSELGQGSTFRVRLPAARPELSLDAPLPAPPPTKTGRLRILVIDDEQEVGQGIRRILGREHTVDVVTRGHAALALLASDSFDVVLCDLMMPELTGMELFARISEAHPAIAKRMVFMSGGAFSAEAKAFLDTVPNPRLDKPIATEALRKLVASITPPSPGERP